MFVFLSMEAENVDSLCRRTYDYDGEMDVWRDRKLSDNSYNLLGTQSVADVVRHGRLRWFRHLKRNNVNDWMSACRKMKVVWGEIKYNVEAGRLRVKKHPKNRKIPT